MSENNMSMVAYTDGACSGNPGPGGWGSSIRMLSGEILAEISGGDKNTTNNIMEMTAVLKTLELTPDEVSVTIYTDSKYVQQGLTEWVVGWAARGWKTSTGQPVKNVELWKELYALYRKKKCSIEWVKGHSGNPGNERADQLSRDAIPK